VVESQFKPLTHWLVLLQDCPAIPRAVQMNVALQYRPVAQPDDDKQLCPAPGSAVHEYIKVRAFRAQLRPGLQVGAVAKLEVEHTSPRFA
jgi:hypothetical protein